MNEQLANERISRAAWFVAAAVTLTLLPLSAYRHVMAAGESYHLVDAWPQTPASLPVGFITWMDVDSKGQLYMFRRCPVKCSDGPHPAGDDPPGSVLLFDPSGKYLHEWEPKSGGKWKEAHSLGIDRHGFIWTSDVQLHVVRKYRSDGALLMTLGKVGVPGETNDTFNKPTNVLVAADDSIFVTDGYGNQRVVKFNKDGKFIKAWGKKGTAPGEFRIPHSVTQDRSGRIIVADRCGLGETKCTDGRIQVFDADGKYATQWAPPGGKFAPFSVAVDMSDRLYVDDTQNAKTWILDAKTLKVIDSIEGGAAHGMSITPSGDDVYFTGGKGGVKRYSRNRTSTQ